MMELIKCVYKTSAVKYKKYDKKTEKLRIHIINTGSDNSGAPARAKRARSGAPWVRKFGKLSIRENLVMT